MGFNMLSGVTLFTYDTPVKRGRNPEDPRRILRILGAKILKESGESLENPQRMETQGFLEKPEDPGS